jgi:hypothetical protein
MLCPRATFVYDIYYTRSTDHGLSWSERELVNDAVEADQWDPDIATDDAGAAYAVWQDMRNPKAQIWFGTNAWTAISEPAPVSSFEFRHSLSAFPNPSRGLVRVSLPPFSIHHSSFITLSDVSGRLVLTRPLDLSVSRSLPLDLRSLPSGVYLLRAPGATPARITLLH